VVFNNTSGAALAESHSTGSARRYAWYDSALRRKARQEAPGDNAYLLERDGFGGSPLAGACGAVQRERRHFRSRILGPPEADGIITISEGDALTDNCVMFE